MMWVSKVPNYDAYGLFRALHSHNPFYAPLRSALNKRHWRLTLHSVSVGAKQVPLAPGTPSPAFCVRTFSRQTLLTAKIEDSILILR